MRSLRLRLQLLVRSTEFGGRVRKTMYDLQRLPRQKDGSQQVELLQSHFLLPLTNPRQPHELAKVLLLVYVVLVEFQPLVF